MNRRHFVGLLGMAGAVAAIAPKVMGAPTIQNVTGIKVGVPIPATIRWESATSVSFSDSCGALPAPLVANGIYYSDVGSRGRVEGCTIRGNCSILMASEVAL